MKKTLTLFFITAAIAAILMSSPEFSITKAFLEKIEREYGVFAKRRAFALVQMMNEVRDQSEMEKLDGVNDFFNHTPYASDKETWGVSDYWATRYELIGKDRGDCEDYVIAKYFTLKELGVPPSKLFMTYAKSLKYKTAHMVLTYYATPRSEPLILDNYNFKILPASQRDDLIPIYSFSGDELFNAKQAQIGKMVPAAAKQTRPWDELIITR
ncbi:MAG: transglutaminase [Sulfuricurvum sp. PD_MW2]|jgi:predicted transglutaminase-like cysteine proteinase|uniref:transglutaminase-like cysteine peptidase n=1 Tax=Sulfuricurvum sp. PD_MW2 TaxID=2027917 RepID=UPI000C064712|nr:transglutaminase-like cysteine peptidase [Sulfuricurvum sp. PD_MW2]PHM16794.1 MAG: transglutaminase [Sulfuricurvum sp. PD_MW2]